MQITSNNQHELISILYYNVITIMLMSALQYIMYLQYTTNTTLKKLIQEIQFPHVGDEKSPRLAQFQRYEQFPIS